MLKILILMQFITGNDTPTKLIGDEKKTLTGAFLSIGLIINFLSLKEMFLISLQGNPILGVSLKRKVKLVTCLFFVSLTLYNLTSVCIFSILFSIHFLRCWQGELVKTPRALLVADHFLHSRNLNNWLKGWIVKGNWYLVTLRD